ncbi:5-oxoprolinase subunit C family protein [Cupriavidus sp. PET2-C1]
MIEILSNGIPNLIQDLGRTGLLNAGVSRSGAMDSRALSLANILVGNDEGAAGLEISLFPFRLKFLADTCFACTGGDCTVRLDDTILAPWWGRQARAGQTLVIERPRRGARAYLAFSGGIDVPAVLGSRSTDLKSTLGGLEGRGLRRGDMLSLRTQGHRALGRRGLGLVPADLPRFWKELSTGCVTVRVLSAAEYDVFTESAKAAFLETEYQVSLDANRMGYRLRGVPLMLSEPFELFSHGIVPGTIQVPPNGQPIIQLAEANTCGGYPKIAVVIEADLWCLAQVPVGCNLRFQRVSLEEALNARRAHLAELAAMRQSLELMSSRA